MPSGYSTIQSKDTSCHNRKGKFQSKFDLSILEHEIDNFKKKNNIPQSSHISHYDVYVYNNRIKRSKKTNSLNLKKEYDYKLITNNQEYYVNTDDQIKEHDNNEAEYEYQIQLEKEEYDKKEWMKEMAREERRSWKAERFLDKMMIKREMHRRAKIKKNKKLD